MTKTNQQKKPLLGHFFEDFHLNQRLVHGVPRTITQADASLYLALTGSRFALHCATTVAENCGFKTSPLDQWLVFHVAFGKTVNDISRNAVANLGYAELLFHLPSYPDDTLSVSSEVIGLKENSSGKTGVVYVRSSAVNQNDQLVVSWVRWVMVKKQNASQPPCQATIPSLDPAVTTSQLPPLPDQVNFQNWRASDSDHQYRLDDFSVGQTLFHQDGMTINDSDHSLATRLYQNNARVHFDQQMMQQTPHGRRLVYGGHIISLCRALSYNGLGNALWLAAVNAGTHANPCFAGDTIYAQTQVIDKQDVKGRQDMGLLRLRLFGCKNQTPEQMNYLFQEQDGRIEYHPNLVLDLDFWVYIVK